MYFLGEGRNGSVGPVFPIAFLPRLNDITNLVAASRSNHPVRRDTGGPVSRVYGALLLWETKHC